MPRLKKKSELQRKDAVKLFRETLDCEKQREHRVKNTEAHKVTRGDVERRRVEQVRDKEAHKVTRGDVERRVVEQLRNTEAHKVTRGDVERRRVEQVRDKEAHKVTRGDVERRRVERVRDKEAHKVTRGDVERREAEQQINTESRRLSRQHTEKCKENFLKAIKCGPDVHCLSCDGLFFKSSTKKLDLSTLIQQFGNEFCENGLRKGNSGRLCFTCSGYILKGKIPKLNFSNGFTFPEIPEILIPQSKKHPLGLTQLEERLVAARIPFMCITRLGVDKQCGLRGNVVNVVNPINETARILPHRLDETEVIPLMLMRRMEYKNPYLFETIRPKKVYDAARFLASSELYKEENIVLSDEWLRDMSNRQPVESVEEIALDNIEPEEVNPGGQQTLLMDFDAIENNEAIKFAPGEGQKPISLLLDRNAEALSFPSIYCGVKRKFSTNVRITMKDIAKSDARNKDRRCAIPSYLLYSYKYEQTHQLANQVQLCLRKKKGSGKPTAGNLIKDEFVENLVQHNDAYKVLRNIRSSPAYWEDKQKVLMAMIRQLGIPTMFITLSAAEVKWLELIVILKKVLDEEVITEEEAERLSWESKADLIRRDPITCSRYFDYRLRQCYKFVLLNKSGIFKDHPVIDSFSRIEFQHRGSPHLHGLFWLEGAPLFHESNVESLKECEEFIDKYIACKKDEPGVIHQQHKHKPCCEMVFKGVKKCRFGMPYPPMPVTKILLPFPTDMSESVKSTASNNLMAVKEQVEYLFSINQDLDFEEFLDYMGLNEMQYIMAVRSSIRRPTVFLKRRIIDAYTNAYNPVEHRFGHGHWPLAKVAFIHKRLVVGQRMSTLRMSLGLQRGRESKNRFSSPSCVSMSSKANFG